MHVVLVYMPLYCNYCYSKGVLSPVGTRGHATTVNNKIVMNLFINLFLVS